MAKMSDFSNHNIFAYIMASCANLNFHPVLCHLNTQFNMYTTTSKQQEGSTCKDSYPNCFIATNSTAKLWRGAMNHGEILGYIVMLRARMFRSLIIRTGIKERNIRARNITI